MKDLRLRACVDVRSSNMKIPQRRLADYVKFFYQKACCTCSTIIFPHSLICCCCRRHFLNFLMLYNAYDFVPKIVLSISALDSEPVTETGSRVISSCNVVARAEENPGNGVVPVAYQRSCV